MHYLDYAATAPILPEVREAMLPYLQDTWGNPSSIYAPGRDARGGIDRARETFADAIGCDPEELVFTGGGTEAANIAVKGTAWAHDDRGRHILLPRIEHHCVLDAAEWLGKHGFEIESVPVDRTGYVSPKAIADALRDDTVLVCVMLANNEIGTIEPVAEIAAICRERGVLTFTDAVQALGKIEVDVRDLGVDMAGFSAHKIGGPKGTGALYVRRGVKLEPVIHGGGQERGRRSGTENVAGIVGLATAATVVSGELATEPQRWRALRNRLLSGIHAAIDDVELNVSFRGVTGSDVLLILDGEGICASTGSACQAGSVEPSHVLAACGVPSPWAQGALRFTVGRTTTEPDVDAVLATLPSTIARLRSFSGSRR